MRKETIFRSTTAELNLQQEIFTQREIYRVATNPGKTQVAHVT